MLAIATLSVLAYGFNEAAGFTQRKRRVGAASQSAPTLCFNEAAGFTQRKLHFHGNAGSVDAVASMRPPVFPAETALVFSHIYFDNLMLQ